MSIQEAIEILAYEADEFRGLARDYKRDLSRLYDRKHQAHLLATKALRDSIPRVLTLEEIDAMLKTGIETPVYNEIKNAVKFVGRSRWNIVGFPTVMSAKLRKAYGYEFRTWTTRPTPEQMAATPWEEKP